MATILLIEDDPTIRLTTEFALRNVGYETISCDNGTDGLDAALHAHADLILLDLRLPGLDGTSLLKQLRLEDSYTPVIILTAYTTDEDKIRNFDAGADDFLAKPFSIEELLARIRANLRRADQIRTIQNSNPVGTVVQEIGDMSIDRSNKVVTIKGKPVTLRNREYQILDVLSSRDGTVTRSELVAKVWNNKIDSTSTTIDVHIHNLRKAIDGPSDYNFISTAYGRGYRLIPQEKK